MPLVSSLTCVHAKLVLASNPSSPCKSIGRAHCRGIHQWPSTALSALITRPGARPAVRRQPVRASAATAVPPSAADMLHRYTTALNERDIDGVMSCLSLDVVHHGLAYAEMLTGRQAVQQFYQQLFSSLPAGVQLVQDDGTEGGSSTAAIIWHLELEERPLPCGEGITFVRLGEDRLISYIRESPEYILKLSRGVVPALGAAMPLFSGLAALSNTNVARSGLRMGLEQGAETRFYSAKESGIAANSGTVGAFIGSQRQSVGRGTRGQARAEPQQEKAAQLRAELATLQAEKAALELRLQPLADEVNTVQVSDQVAFSQIASGAPPLQASRPISGSMVAEPGAPDLRAVVRNPEPPMRTSSGGGSGSNSRAAKGADLRADSRGSASSDASIQYTPPAGYPFSTSGSEMDDNDDAGKYGIESSSSAESMEQSRDEVGAEAISPAPKDDVRPTLAMKVSPVNSLVEDRAGLGRLAGVWIKDREASDLVSYSRTLDLMRLGPLQRDTAMNLIEGFEIVDFQGGFKLKFLTVVPFFNVTETYRINELTLMGRRDMKAGQQQARAQLIANGLSIEFKWGAPDPANLEDTYTLKPDGTLHVRSVVRAGSKMEETLQVYRRADQWQPQNEWGSGRALGLVMGWRNPFGR